MGSGQTLPFETPISGIWYYWICSLLRYPISEKARCMLQISLANKVFDWFNLHNAEKTNSKDYRIIDIFLLAFSLKIMKIWLLPFFGWNRPSGVNFTKNAKNTAFSGFAGLFFWKSTFKQFSPNLKMMYRQNTNKKQNFTQNLGL